MDRLKKYQQVVINILKEYVANAYSSDAVSFKVVVDKENHQYQVVMMGWENGVYFHECPIHIDIIDNKIWVQQNMTEWDLGIWFEKNKIPKSDIILGFLSPATRSFSDYAVA